MTAKEIMESISDEDFLSSIVRYAGVSSLRRGYRWSHVSKITGHGSGVSQELCKRFGVDPDELVGGFRPDDYECCPTCGTDLLDCEDEDDE